MLPTQLAGPGPPPRDSSPIGVNFPLAACSLAGEGCAESDVVEMSRAPEESPWKPTAANADEGREEAPPDDAEDCAMI